MVVTNPYKANQYRLDPRQQLCWDFYIDPKSETFSNGLQSALKAGYEPEYAAQITVAPWFLEKLRKLELLPKAEKVLEEILDMEVSRKEPILFKVKQDTAKFIAERLGKAQGYSTRSEITGKDGKDLPAPILGGITKTDDGEV